MARRRNWRETPGSQSAGYHYGGTPKHPAPTKTPTVAPPPSEAATSPAGNYSGAAHEYTQAVASLPKPARDATTAAIRTLPTTNPLTSRYLLHEISDLLTPGPTAQETAAAAARLGVKPNESLLGKVGGAIDNIAADFSKGAKAVAQEATKAAQLPRQAADTRVTKFSGHPTLGKPTLAQLLSAVNKNQIRVNRRGKVTVPATRQAAQGLQAARQQYAAKARPDTSGLTPQEKAVIPYVLKAHRKYPDVPVSVLMAQIKQESGFNPAAVSSAGAQGLSQFIPGTAQEYGVRYGTGRREQQSQVTGQAHYLHNLGFGSDPQAALSSYSGGYAAGDYNNPILSDARASYSALDKPTVVPPRVLAALKQAKGEAHNIGIPIKAGDVEPGPAPKTVFVRADAKGFVDWAKALLGTQEGSRLQLKWAAESGISAAQPWCAAFITAGVARRGLTPPSDPAYSGSWLNWNQGANIGTDLRKAKPGDIIVFGASEHIGLYTGGGNVIAGNWSNEVAEYPASEDSRGIEGIVRPRFSGKKVAVQESTVLPGAAIGPGGAIVSGPAGASGEAVGAASTPSQGRSAAPVALGSILTPNMATAALPAAFRQFQEGAAPEPAEEGLGGIIDAILKRRRA